jgi:cohesin loading factor subunit SCC2
MHRGLKRTIPGTSLVSTLVQSCLRVVQVIEMNEVGSLSSIFYRSFIFLPAPLEKLSALIEDIFEAEDSLAVDIDVSELPKDFFSALTTDCSQPHLQANVIKKLTKHLSQLARPTKRSRRSARDSVDTPRARKALGDIDNTILARLLKILERSIKAGEALDPLRASTHAPHADKNASPRKQKKGSRVQRVVHQDRDITSSASLNVPEEDTHELEVDSADMPQELTEADLHDLSKQLEVARDSIFAVECCVALLSGEGLTKQVCSSGQFPRSI